MNTFYRKTALIAVTASLSLSLGGCLFNRVAEVKGQFCDFDSNFDLDFARSAEFHFRHPVMLDSDILWLTASEPTETVVSGNKKRMVFVMEKTGVTQDPSTDIRVELEFDALDEEFRLASIRFDPKLSALINPEVLDRVTIEEGSRMMCDTGYSLVSKEVELDLSGQSFDDLPSRLELLEMLGPPLEHDPVNSSFTYEYRLKGSEDDPFNTRFTVWFDDSGEKLARMESRYSHFHSSTDFINKKMRVQLKMLGG